MDIFLAHFVASITIAGFIAVFLVFRYQTIDSYVDTRKPLLRSLLNENVLLDPQITLKIQDIGKGAEADETTYFDQFQNQAVIRLVTDIWSLRRLRTKTVTFGLLSIGLWAGLSVFYVVNAQWVASTSREEEMIITSIVLFTLSLVFTGYFISVSLEEGARI